LLYAQNPTTVKSCRELLNRISCTEISAEVRSVAHEALNI